MSCLALSCPFTFHHGVMQHEGPCQIWPFSLGLPGLQNHMLSKFLMFIRYPG